MSLRTFKYIWIFGLITTGLIMVIPVLLVMIKERDTAVAEDDPWANMPSVATHTDHAALLTGPYENGREVTAACLTCHTDAAHDLMQTTHWTWESEPTAVEGREGLVTVGKANSLNNFCIGIQSNWSGCTKCHAGYGWDDADYFVDAGETDVDCLVCHDQSGQYRKGSAGEVAEGVDLALAAQSVGRPTRENCGSCHFNGGGGNAVKHGDLDESLYFPSENVDVHMGRHNFQCVDCHRTEDHNIGGKLMSVNFDTNHEDQIACTDCHAEDQHNDDRINSHVDAVACQTCHVPQTAVRTPTKIVWDWSQAGQDREEDQHVYLKIKGAFIYTENLLPEFAWWDGTVDRYLFGDIIDPTTPANMAAPLGDITDANAMIWPFKVHYSIQPYDAVNNYLLQPQTVGEGGYWTTFDWNSALERGSAIVGMDYSGEYGFAPTLMYWPQTHMVAPAEQALQCTSCHGETGRMDWLALGYPGDPMIWGGR